MEAMTVAVIVALLALVVAIVAGSTWRRTADARRSVKDHQRTLETLRQLPERRVEGGGSPSVPPRAASKPSSPPVETRAAPAAPPSETGSDSPSELVGSSQPRGDGRSTAGKVDADVDGGTRQTPVVVDDPGPKVLARYQDPTAVTWSARPDVETVAVPSAPRLASPLMDPDPLSVATNARHSLVRNRPLAMAAAAVMAVAAVVALALTLPSSRSPRSATGHSRPTQPRPGHRSSLSAVVSPSSSSTYAATYSVPRGSFTVALNASAPCWVYATDSAKGTVVWTATMSAGQQHTIEATKALVVRLGSSNVTVNLDGRPVQFPSGFRVPFNMTFQPS
ncbi:MAG TPA: DUF4115 domain-containing protein [Acidimicrobiales bacterium]|nr:DUF4115 domain-containing protein [Acidimicrobiales bacterium]